jgi:hypothetical protein
MTEYSNTLTVIPFITNMIGLLDILCEGHHFTSEILIEQISPQIYKKSVSNLLDTMMLKELSFKQQIKNEYEDEDDNDEIIIARYDIGCQWEIIIDFDKNTQLTSIDIGFDIPGLNIYETELYNKDAVLHALFLYLFYTFKNIHNLPYRNICEVPKCIYFKQHEKQFCCECCLEDKINSRCILLKQQGRNCNCKICKIIRKII